MSTHEKETFFGVYGYAETWQDLPWSHETQTDFLTDIVAEHDGTGAALDIGCGGGTDSLYMAREGWDTTALDFMPKALDMTRERAAAEGLTVKTVEADIIEWAPDRSYDLVLDHGLLHNMDPVRYAAYREKVMSTIAPGGNFVILHWLQRTPEEQQAEMGPRRVSREDINKFFAPELVEHKFTADEHFDLPESVSKDGTMSQATYWFRRP
ncbi:MAG: class I SAM-dependent methyltransferase [Gammaproteobacteria bacterium]